MEKLTVGLFSKVLMDSINENIRKIVKDYAEYLEPAKETIINCEATFVLFQIKEIICDESLDEKDKTQKIRDIYDKYDLDFDNLSY